MNTATAQWWLLIPLGVTMIAFCLLTFMAIRDTVAGHKRSHENQRLRQFNDRHADRADRHSIEQRAALKAALGSTTRAQR